MSNLEILTNPIRQKIQLDFLDRSKQIQLLNFLNLFDVNKSHINRDAGQILINGIYGWDLIMGKITRRRKDTILDGKIKKLKNITNPNSDINNEIARLNMKLHPDYFQDDGKDVQGTYYKLPTVFATVIGELNEKTSAIIIKEMVNAKNKTNKYIKEINKHDNVQISDISSYIVGKIKPVYVLIYGNNDTFSGEQIIKMFNLHKIRLIHYGDLIKASSMIQYI